MREATIHRKTNETDVTVVLHIDGDGSAQVDTGVGFFDHMMCAFARFAMVKLTVHCTGDIQVDAHHTVEDVGLCLGRAIHVALGGKQGIRRVGQASVPMDEALATAILDVSGRPCLVFDAAFAAPAIGAMDTQLVEDFFRALSNTARVTLHLAVPYGRNDHHKAEALFKAFGRALDEACQTDARLRDVLSTKGVL
ncbi:MAG: imidazoleglycerol-phosphate dehydratase HisB [Oscillospiraceae bacterium]|nr:imidazoleglycerol-phosphate dehydratase HisB [Oscillospiraceae bacterium]